MDEELRDVLLGERKSLSKWTDIGEHLYVIIGPVTTELLEQSMNEDREQDREEEDDGQDFEFDAPTDLDKDYDLTLEEDTEERLNVVEQALQKFKKVDKYLDQTNGKGYDRNHPKANWCFQETRQA